MVDEMHDIELILILALYYIDNGKNIDGFTKKYNRYFKKEVSTQTILYSISKFRNVDPANNIQSNSENNEHVRIWNEYIVREKFQELKEIYSEFKKDIYINRISVFPNSMEEMNFVDFITLEDIKDYPQKKPDDYKEKGISVYPRNREVACNALALAEYKCEAQCDNVLFNKKGRVHFYTEAHHLIPLCYQDYFEYSLDVEANVVSLCPICHRRVHYGSVPELLIKKLYEARRNRLNNCNINISFEKLLLIYR